MSSRSPSREPGWCCQRAAQATLRQSTLVDGPLPLVLLVASLLFAAVVLVYVVLDRTPDWGLLGFAAVIEALTLVLLVVAVVQVGDVDLTGGRLVTLFGYLLAGLVLLPIGFAWSLAERSRGATAVLMVAGLAQAFVVVRVMQVWPS